MPLSKRIRAGQNQIACVRENAKRPTSVRKRPSKTLWSLEQHRAKVEDIEKALQERRNHLEHLHREEGAEASHEAEATQLDVVFPDGITKHLPQEAKDSFKSAADLNEEERKAAREAAARPAKEWAWMTRMTSPPKHGSKRALTSCCMPKPGVTQKGWQYCGHKWPETSAHQCLRRSRSKGGMNPSRAAEISIVTGNGKFWTTHREWMAHVGPRHLVLGQEHPLEASRCEEEAVKLERQGWLCGFSPAKRNALKTKSDSSLATSVGTFVAAPTHWGMEWAWPARNWQRKELQAHQGRLAMAWVPIVEGLTVLSVYFYHTEEWTERKPTVAGGAEPRNPEVPWAVGRGGRFQHRARDLWAICHTCETARSVGQANWTHLQTWSIGSML